MLTFIKSFAVLATLAAAGTAVAQPLAEDAPPTAVVSYADLDIGTAAGLHTLQGRIHAAASRMCLSAGRKPLQAQMAERRCMSAALSSGKIGVEQALAQRAVRLASRPEMQVSAR